jgi:endonuclease/exonuclease/phosphatase family metal-dependent hydrolase
MQRRSILGGLGAMAVAAIGCRTRVAMNPAIVRPAGALRVMTLNLAHGRGRVPAHGLIRDPAVFRQNLDAVASVLLREAPDVVALQEAEMGSPGAGDFDHVGYLAARSGYSQVVATPHMNEEGRFCYGTAMLSRLPMAASEGGTFQAQGRWRKGFTRAVVRWDEDVVVIGLHLDFARASRRRAQLEELAAAMIDEARPMVVMGDFNSAWSDRDRSGLGWFAAKLGLRAWAPELGRGGGVGTFPQTGGRLDWILASASLGFAGYATLRGDRVSDHVPVLADLRRPRPAIAA